MGTKPRAFTSQRPLSTVLFDFCTQALLNTHVRWKYTLPPPLEGKVKCASFKASPHLSLGNAVQTECLCFLGTREGDRRPAPFTNVVVGRGPMEAGMGRYLSGLTAVSIGVSCSGQHGPPEKAPIRRLSQAAACTLHCYLCWTQRAKKVHRPDCSQERLFCSGCWGWAPPCYFLKSSGPAGLWLSLGPEAVND